MRSLLKCLAVTAIGGALCLSQAWAEENGEDLKGKIIRSIDIELQDVFEGEDPSFFYKLANGAKISTKESVVRRELLFKEGDPYDDFLIKESERVLRGLRFLRNIRVIPKVDGNFVDLTVRVQDTWTLIPQINFSTGTGRNRRSAGIADNNLLGYGKRLEFLYDEDKKITSFQSIWEDPRVFGTDYRLLGAYFDRDDGENRVLTFDRPFRSLLDTFGWITHASDSDVIGRLFEDGDENFIFRDKSSNFNAAYTIARGSPHSELRRYTAGYAYSEDRFFEAEPEDFDILDLDPADLEMNPELLAEDRRFSGPTLSYQNSRPDYIPMSYVDRFDRVDDYDVGSGYSLSTRFAPEFLGSRLDTLLLAGSRSQGYRFDSSSFTRGEIRGGTRLQEDGFYNTQVEAEMKYFNVMTPLSVGDIYVGKHTLAFSGLFDYAHRLDKDKQFLLGGDNGVRGYKARSFTGDKRLALNIEDRVHFVDDVFKIMSMGGAVFLDVGSATERSLPNLFSDDLYADIGFGLRFGFPRSAGGRVFRIDLALPLREGPDGSGAFEPRVIFAGGLLFSSKLRSETAGAIQTALGLGPD